MGEESFRSLVNNMDEATCSYSIKKEETSDEEATFPPPNIEIKKEEIDLGAEVVEVSDEDDDSCLCEECGFTTHSEKMFERHTGHHTLADKKFLICGRCPYSTRHKGELNIHIVTTHPQDIKPLVHKLEPIEAKPEPPRVAGTKLHASAFFDCGSCGFEGKCSQQLLRHFLYNPTHTLGEQYVCGGKCPFKTSSRVELFQHVHKNHPQSLPQMPIYRPGKAPPATYRCSKCDFKGDTKEGVIAHMKGRHPKHAKTGFMLQKVAGQAAVGAKTKTYKCGKCNFRATERRSVVNHIAWVHRPKQSIRWYQCGRCGYRAPQEQGISLHLSECLVKEARCFNEPSDFADVKPFS